jgi:hypothetical protein
MGIAKRSAASLVAFCVLLCAPGSSWAQAAAVVEAGAGGAALSLPARAFSIQASGGLALPPGAFASPLPSRLRPPGFVSISRPEGARAARLDKRIAALSRACARDLRAVADSQAEGGRAIAEAGFARVLGEPEVHRPADSGTAYFKFRDASPRKGPVLHTSRKDGRKTRYGLRYLGPAKEAGKAPASRGKLAAYLSGVAIYKTGMDSLMLGVPLLALTTFGSAAWAAALASAWGLSQVMFGSLSGGLLDRNSPSKVFAWAMGLQALVTGSILGLYCIDAFYKGLLPFAAFNPYAVLVLYGIAGGLIGVADVSKQVVAPVLAGSDEKEVKILDARTHIAYEVSGTLSALAAGWVMRAYGVGAILPVLPAVFLASCLLFSFLRLPMVSPPVASEGEEMDIRPMKGGIKRVFSDLKEGARTIFSRPMLRWGLLALVLPMMMHKVFETVLIPVFAKSVLHAPAAAGWMLSASNLGELLGALALTLSMHSKHPKHSYFWVRLMAAGAMAVWVFSASRNLALILPMITLRGLTWAASDLSLRGKIQTSLAPGERGKALGFITSTGFFLIMSSSLGIGFWLDGSPHELVFLGVAAVFTLLAAAVVLASFHLKKIKHPAEDPAKTPFSALVSYRSNPGPSTQPRAR